MIDFDGFTEEDIGTTLIPDLFFKELLPSIDHLGELKLCLYFFWRFSQMEGKFRYIKSDDLQNDSDLAMMFEAVDSNLDESLSLAIEDGILLSVDLGKLSKAGHSSSLYFLNTPKGRAAIEAISKGQWTPTRDLGDLQLPLEEPPNIYRLYEENIGPITPMIAEALKDAEDNFPMEWIEDAIRIAVERNKRNWRYCTAILERWHREGRNAREETKDRGDAEEARQRYIKGQFSDFIEH